MVYARNGRADIVLATKRCRTVHSIELTPKLHHLSCHTITKGIPPNHTPHSFEQLDLTLLPILRHISCSQVRELGVILLCGHKGRRNHLSGKPSSMKCLLGLCCCHHAIELQVDKAGSMFVNKNVLH
uniref:Pco133413 n=1 Tax=Arundo donax TaxID=35708 RepID=A0A0A9D9S7_ARUDO